MSKISPARAAHEEIGAHMDIQLWADEVARGAEKIRAWAKDLKARSKRHCLDLEAARRALLDGGGPPLAAV